MSKQEMTVCPGDATHERCFNADELREAAFFIDYSRCIGCECCVAACSASEAHCGPNITANHTRVPVQPHICMHCENAICALVCPANAYEVTPEGVVQRRRGALHRLFMVRHRLSIRCSQVRQKPERDNEMRPVLRPQRRRQNALVCGSLFFRRTGLHNDGRDSEYSPNHSLE